MLVLSRKLNEKIIINDEITIMVTKITPNQVGIAIEAPRHIPIHRFEVWEEIQEGKDKP
jgi:carbon storage regulator